MSTGTRTCSSWGESTAVLVLAHTAEVVGSSPAGSTEPRRIAQTATPPRRPPGMGGLGGRARTSAAARLQPCRGSGVHRSTGQSTGPRCRRHEVRLLVDAPRRFSCLWRAEASHPLGDEAHGEHDTTHYHSLPHLGPTAAGYRNHER